MLHLGERCGLAESTVWKVEHGHPVRWETVHLLLVVGMRIMAESPIYAEMHSLWLRQRQDLAMRIGPGHNAKRLPKAAVEAVRKFRILIRDMEPAAMAKVLRAAQRQASLLETAPSAAKR